MSYSSKSFEFQSLESRQLMAGVTLLIHGNQGNITGWVGYTADAIAARVGKGAASEYVMKVGLDSKKKLAVLSMTLKSGPAITSASSGEAIVEVDWTDVDDGSQSTTDVGAAVANYMLTSHGSAMPALASLPIDMIGHSRGASMVVAITEDLGKAGVMVDQNTYLDPHPVGSYFGFGYNDHDMDVYSNVEFADDYWRDNGQGDFSVDPNGQSVDGTHQGDLNKTVGKYYTVSAHSGVPAYYEGTVDFNSVWDGDEPILASKWYGTSTAVPPRNHTGFYYTRINGGARPADGLSAAFGGTASRKDVGESGTQWGNTAEMKVAGGSNFIIGSRISVHYMHQDRDGSDQIQLFLDTDTNPFNGAVKKIRDVSLGEDDAVTALATTGATDGVDPGTYYVYAKITDAAGHYRYAYVPNTITLTAPVAVASFSPPTTAATNAPSNYTSVASSIFSDAMV